MSKSTGRLTLPIERGFLKETKDLMERWGADAVRDSDGTKHDQETLSLPATIYSTYFVARNFNDFIQNHMEEVQKLYLMSPRKIATQEELTIFFMEGYFVDQIQPNYHYDPQEWWQVINRTTGEIIPVEQWAVNEEENSVTIKETELFHEYTVSFLADKIWDPTHMYNYITNNWDESIAHDIPFDVRGEHSKAFIAETLEQWCQDNPQVDVVRFTTFFYHFTLVFNDLGKEKFVDWFGYGASVSPAALLAFEEEYGYALTPEDFVDEGYYNSTFRVPSQAYLDYVDFTSRFVAEEAKKLVDIVHSHGKEAMMFLGDNWIGTEPYGPYFKKIGLEAVVGSVGGGATLRLISDIPHVKYTEGRFLPYFFPDTFYEGNDPTIEAKDNWLAARRAIMRSPVDRIGYGGYPSLAYQFPEFVSYIEQVADEFRSIYDVVHDTKPYVAMKVAILNAWGELRSWQTHMVAHALHYKQIYSYLGILEILSGAAVDVTFISFDDILADGIPNDIDVIINAGDAQTAFSGGDYWLNPELVSAIRSFVYNGGGFIGVGEPSAILHNGRYFQLADVLGVDKELGFSLSTDKYFETPMADHFITEDAAKGKLYFGESMKNIYALSGETQIIEFSQGEIHLSSHDYGKGRGIYIAGLPYNVTNTRLLMRALYYAANKEDQFNQWQSQNPNVEVHAYPDKSTYAIINNTQEVQETIVYDGDQQSKDYTLQPGEIIWEAI